MSSVVVKLCSLAQKCEDAGLKAEAALFDAILKKVATAVSINVQEDPSQNQWLATSNPPHLTVSSPIYNPADDRSPENHARGIQVMRKTLRDNLNTSYPHGTHFVFNPPQFAS